MKISIFTLLISTLCTTAFAENNDQMPVPSKKPLMTIQSWSYTKNSKTQAVLEVTLNGDNVPTLLALKSNSQLSVVHDYDDVYAVYFTVKNGQYEDATASEWAAKRACKINFSLNPANPSIFTRDYSKSSPCAPYNVDGALNFKEELVINRIPE